MGTTLRNTSILVASLLVAFTSYAHADDASVALKMQHLQAQIQALDAQRELMQINYELLGAVSSSIQANSDDILNTMGPGLPEHRQGLAQVSQTAAQMTRMARKNDVNALVPANAIRNACMSCHADTNPPGGIDWDHLFKMDWANISQHCRTEGKNPYLCKSMNGMLSVYGYLLSAERAEIRDFAATEQAAGELARILADLKSKNFKHLPEEFRSRAEDDAREIVRLARAQDPQAFARAKGVNQTCTQCHRNVNAKPIPLSLR